MFNKQRLIEILKTMDIPEFRLTSFYGDVDLKWLNRNLFIRNSEHPNIKEAHDLIREGIKETMLFHHSLNIEERD